MQIDSLSAAPEIVSGRLDTRDIDREARRAAYLEAINHSLDTQFLDDACDAALIGFYLGDLHVIHFDAPR